MKLLNGDIYPIGQTIGFIKADIKTVLNAYLEWYNSLDLNVGRSVTVNEVKGNLKHVLMYLLPLNNIEDRRQIFIPTNSNWVAYTDNSLGQANLGTIGFLSRKYNWEGLKVASFPDYSENNNTSIRWGGGYIVYLNGNKLVRKIEMMWDDKWDFETFGDPLPFEQVEKYKLKKIQDKFTPEMLNVYCKALGVDFYNKNYYMPENSIAYLIDTKGPLYEGMEEYTLEEARKYLGYDTVQ